MSVCKFDAQGMFKCTSETKPTEISKTLEKFSIASDAVMSYAANKCPENFKKPSNFNLVSEESVIGGFDPATFSQQSIE